MATNSTFRTLLASAALVMSTVASQQAAARQLSADEAFNRAVGILPAGRGMMTANSTANRPELVYTEETEGEPTVYVFNQQGGGCWIVAANDAVSNGLLGYTDNGEFDVDNMPHNVADILSSYGEQVAYASAQSSLVRTQRQSRVARVAVEPLVAAHWGQAGVYNAYAPVAANGQRCPAGCIAVSMAQIMNVYGAPTSGTGSISYKPAALTEYLSYDFDANPINWDEIKLNSRGLPANTAAGDAVARLIYACGMSVKMNFAASGSGSSVTNAARALVSTFNYDRGIGIMDRQYFDDQQWEEMLYTEISEGRPVIYSARTAQNAGHAFVIDGYNTDGYYHVNWGWEGGYDGYFLLSALDPAGNGQGYVSGDQMAVGIQPATATNTLRPVFQFQGDITVDKTEVTRSSAGTVKISSARGIYNQSVEALTVTLGVHLIGTDGTESYITSTTTKNFLCGGATLSYTLPQNQFPTSGRYLLTPCIRTADGNWTEMNTTSSCERALYVDCTPTGLIFTPESEMVSNESQRDIAVSGLSIRNGKSLRTNVEMRARFVNTSNNYYIKKLIPTLMDANGNTVATGTAMTIELEAQELEDTEWNSSLNDHVADGIYTMALVDNKGRVFGSPIEVEVINDEIIGTASTDLETQGIEELDADLEAAEILSTEIYNTSGRLIATVAAADLDSASLPAGIYILRHTLSNGTTTTAKKAIR